jgi:hypothetical protein
VGLMSLAAIGTMPYRQHQIISGVAIESARYGEIRRGIGGFIAAGNALMETQNSSSNK